MKIKNSLIILFVFTALYVHSPTPVMAQFTFTPGLVITVDSGIDASDALPGDRICATAAGECTLRAAIEEANTSTSGIRDVIIFGLERPAVIDLTLGELRVEHSMDIVGPGARHLTVRRSFEQGTPNFRIFHILPGIVYLTIRGMTIKNGWADTGGGVLVESSGNLQLIDSALIGNHATAGGGGAASSGKLLILRCLLASNIAEYQGGAIVNTGISSDTTITDSTLTANSAVIGGAISNEGALLLINDTISGNSASAAGSSILNGTLGTVRVLNTIIGRDISQKVPALLGAFQSAGHNIVTDVGTATGFTDGVNGDHVSQNNAIDPMLGNLLNNEGETDTLAPQPGSLAIGNADSCVYQYQCSQLPGIFIDGGLTDQRRRWRRDFVGPDPPVDIGAYETDGTGPQGPNGLNSEATPGPRYANSPVVLINATTLERRYTVVRPSGKFEFSGLPYAPVYILEIRAKRVGGAITPQVIAFD
jgi:hypothetical protein